MRDRASFLLLAGVVALFFAPALALRGVFYQGDVGNYTSRLAFTGECILRGHLPLWNPFLSLGGPHAADPVTLGFYPLHLLLASLLGTWFYGYDAALHVLMAAAGTFAFARALGMTRPAALLAAIAYALSGFAFGHLQHLNVLVGMAWIPIVLATTERYLATSDRRSLAAAMLAVGLSILGGHTQIALYGILALAAYCAFRLAGLWHRGDGRWPRLATGLLALVLVGLALSAVFLVPFAEWMEFVGRRQRFRIEDALTYSLPPVRLVGLVAPFWFGGSPERPWYSGMLVEWSSYVGLLPLTLAVVALARPSGRVLLFLGMALSALLLAQGEDSSLYRLLLSVPLVGWVRAPARFLVVAALALALLAGNGFDALRTRAGRFWACCVAAGLLLVALDVTIAAARGKRSSFLLPRCPDPLSLHQPDTLVLLALLAGAAGLLFVLARSGTDSPFLVALVLAFSTGDLFVYQHRLLFNDLAPRDVFERPSESAEAIRKDGGTNRFYTLIEKEPWRTLERRRDVDTYRLLMWESLRNSLPMRFGLQSLTGLQNEPPMHARLIDVLNKRGEFDSRSARLAGIFGVRYVIAAGHVTAPEATLVFRGLLDLYRNETAVPRAYLVPASLEASSADAAFAVVKRPDFDPRRTVVLEAADLPMRDGPPLGGTAAIALDEPDRVAIEVAPERDAWLVLNDTFAPGWTATVDGHPATVLRANALVRAVAVAAGRHRVEFAYAPASVRRGAWISAVALIAVLAVAFSPASRARTGDRVLDSPSMLSAGSSASTAKPIA